MAAVATMEPVAMPTMLAVERVDEEDSVEPGGIQRLADAVIGAHGGRSLSCSRASASDIGHGGIALV
jgi:hypothetical protein